MIALCLASCTSTSTLIGENSNTIIKTETSTSHFYKQRIDFIESYITKIDFKANDNLTLDINSLSINGDKRIITTDESDKNVVYKNNSIVRVKFKNHLHNNFIKSKVFYYDNDELVCIKLIDILPNELNEVGLRQRTIYIHDNKPISDSDILSSTDVSNELVALGQEYLKNEYQSLN